MVVLFGMLSVISGLVTAGNNFRPEWVAAKIAVLNRSMSFPELSVGSDACGAVHLIKVVCRGDAFAEALLKLDASLVNGTFVTPLDHAIYTHNMTAIAWLADRGTGLNHIDSLGHSPLEFAVYRNNVAVIKVLLDRGADVNLRTIQKRTALMTAILFSRYESFWFLLPLSDISLIDDRGYTALFYAVEKNCCEFVQLLLDAGADARTWSSSCHTVLMAAVRARASQSVLTALVRAGADVDARGPDGRTALAMAADADLADSVHALLSLGAAVRTEDAGAIWAMNTRLS